MSIDKHLYPYTPAEEKWNVFTHALGALASFIGLGVLLKTALHTHSPMVVFAAVVFGISLCILYTCSTLYHSCKGVSNSELGPVLASKKRFFRILDHSSIYILISGTYTPITLLAVHTPTSAGLCVALWLCTFVCIGLKLFFVNSFKIISVLSYLGMGWSALLILMPLYHSVSAAIFTNIVIGGVFYTVGVIAYLMKHVRYHHAVWHMFVLAGSAFHYFAVLFLLQTLG